ncbi:trimethylamine methyltransferase family protein [Chloroflexota bacterium]
MCSETPDIKPFTSPFNVELLTQAQLDTPQDGTLRLLDEVGVHFPSQRALEIFADHGARVDMDTKIARIPPDLVKKAMSTAPRSFVLRGAGGALLPAPGWQSLLPVHRRNRGACG